MTEAPTSRSCRAKSRHVGANASRLRSKRTVMVCLGLLLATPALADSNLPPARWANEQLPDPRQEAQAKALMEEIRCLVCQGQSVADSDAEMAGDMRHLIRTRIAAGEKPSAIRAWLIERYGDWVTYRPTAEPVNWPLWIAPILFLGFGLLLLRKRIRYRKRA